MITAATIIVFGTSLVLQWQVSRGNLRSTYWLMLINGTALTVMNGTLAINAEGQAAVALLCASSVWRGVMGLKGINRLNRVRRST